MDFCFGKRFVITFCAVCKGKFFVYLPIDIPAIEINCCFMQKYEYEQMDNIFSFSIIHEYGCCKHCYFCSPSFLSVSAHDKPIDGWQWVTESAIVYMVTEELLHNSQLVVGKTGIAQHDPATPCPWLRSPSAHYWPFQNLLLSSQDRLWMNDSAA